MECLLYCQTSNVCISVNVLAVTDFEMLLGELCVERLLEHFIGVQHNAEDFH